MSEWNTRITNVQIAKPELDDGNACLVLIYPPGPEMGKRFELIESSTVLGRGSDCDILVDRDSVSRRHAKVFKVGSHWMVEDLGSTNGSYVNDAPIQRSVIRDSDFLKIGSAIFKFLRGMGVESSYHEEIYRMTIIDALTGAHNKRYFLEFLDREIARCARYQRPLSLIMFDIDHFKSINDTHGHLTGDFVLKEMLRRLLCRIRKEELLARYGGEEFAAVLPETDHMGAMHFAEEIRLICGTEPFSFEGDCFPVTISAGVSTLNGQTIDINELIARADENLYQAKRNGRNQVVG